VRNLWKDKGLYEVRREHDACGIGAVVHISGKKDHSIVELGKQILLNLNHRGAAGADDLTGDGAGILLQIPHEFFQSECKKIGISGFHPGQYAVGMVFGSKDPAVRTVCEEILEKALAFYGLKVLGWRQVPVRPDCLGPIALSAEPVIRQIFVDGGGRDSETFERDPFKARKRAERLVREKLADDGVDFYIPTLSCRTICYKGMFMARQLFEYYPDLSDERMTSALAIVHQRYSTNTLPNWRLAQPFRCIAHNGEINTLSGNRNYMRMREKRLRSPVLGEDLSDLIPVLDPQGSDSACFDNMVELLVRAGRSLPHAMMMMVPEAFGVKYHISTDKRAFYEYHSAILEPWDGPAAMLFTDGRLVGGTLDRNGLRPCRYTVTTDGLVVMASETGVVQFPPERVSQKGRLQPGKMFLIDTEEGRIITDNEIKGRIARQKPYRRWLEENRIELRGLFSVPDLEKPDLDTLFRRLRLFGYTREELRMILAPMALHAQEPVGSMGNDTPLAVLSDRPCLLFDYFKQLFAQVTNPPIDPLREGLVMSLMTYTGRRLNLLEETPQHCRQLKLPHPILTNEDMVRLRSAQRKDFKVVTVSTLFEMDRSRPGDSLKQALDALIDSAAQAILRDDASLIILSDRNPAGQKAPIPSLLAVSAVHHGLIERGLRGEAGLIVETGEAREVMHFCLLCGYGANAVNPYLVFETLTFLQQNGDLPADMEPEQIADNYIAAVKKGILKTMSKMGISTLRSYFNAQLFECLGLNRDVVDRYFTGTSSRIGGIGLEEIAQDILRRMEEACKSRPAGSLELDYGGQYHYRRDGEYHLWNPATVAKLQHAVMLNDWKVYEEFARLVNEQSRKLGTLRGLFEFREAQPVPLDEVEPAESIVRRFCTGAMSHGSISKEAHECIAAAMNGLGAMSNTGEGGGRSGSLWYAAQFGHQAGSQCSLWCDNSISGPCQRDSD